MATFDRFDICEAWYIFLANNHGGQGSREYARLSRLQVSFKPRGSLRGAEDLTPNGLEIYLQLSGNELPVVDEAGQGNTIYEMWAGAYACTKCLVRADSFESAFEAFAEWLDDNAPGCLTWCDYEAAARELGYPTVADVPETEIHKLDALAETDMTVIGHTTLDNGNAIPSWEWGGQEVSL